MTRTTSILADLETVDALATALVALVATLPETTAFLVAGKALTASPYAAELFTERRAHVITSADMMAIQRALVAHPGVIAARKLDRELATNEQNYQDAMDDAAQTALENGPGRY